MEDTVKKEVILGKKLFEFTSFDNWCNTAQRKFKNAGFGPGQAVHSAICLDQKGRVCTCGKHFMTARDDNSFPIEVFLIE
jgi:hypothetical protein